MGWVVYESQHTQKQYFSENSSLSLLLTVLPSVFTRDDIITGRRARVYSCAEVCICII